MKAERSGRQPATENNAHLNAGVYALLIHVIRPLRRRVGALGLVTFAAGRYVYVGSAQRGLRARVARHMRRAKPKHWHIDYLTTAPGVRVCAAVSFPGDRTGECVLNRRAQRRLGGVAAAAGLGASDCASGCGAHLWRVRPATTERGLLRLAEGGVIVAGGGAQPSGRTSRACAQHRDPASPCPTPPKRSRRADSRAMWLCF